MKKPTIWCLLGVSTVVLVFLAAFLWWYAESRPPISISQGEIASGSIEVSAVDGERININTATLAQLQTLPGIGPVYAERILQYRLENGPFSSVSQLTLVKGIGLSLLDQILDYITVGDQP